MRILFLTPQLPFPADKGTRIRNFGLVKQLARRHEVGVISFGDPDDRASIDALSAYARVLAVVQPPTRGRAERAARAVLDPMPDLARRLGASALTAQVEAALATGEWDVLQVEALEMAPHWLRTRPTIPVVLDEHNAEWILQARHAAIDARSGRLPGAFYSWLQARKLRRYEGKAVERADAVVAVSAEDEAAIRDVGRPRRLTIVPNGVDCEALRPREGQPAGDTLLFTGTMDYRPNVDAARWFAAEVWPLIRAARPSARFVVCGRDPAPSVRALADRPGVTVTGEVADTAPYFREAALYVAPLRIGGGVRLKILEAFAHGVPVVSTRLGAEGIDLVDRRDALLADEPRSFAEAVVTLLGERERRAELLRCGRQLVELRYDWGVLVPALEALYGELLGGGVTGRGTVAQTG